MKKLLLIGMVSLAATMGLGMAADAYDGNYKHHHHQQNQWQNNQNNQLREDSRFVLRRTGMVLERAMDMARDRRDRWDRDGHHGNWGHHNKRNNFQNRRFRPLGMAFAFQNRAIELYRQGDYQMAINFSLRSRAIALRVIDRLNGSDDWGRGDWDNNRWGNDDDYRDCDMDRGELDVREVRYWDRRPHGNEFGFSWTEVDDDQIFNFHVDLNF